MNRTSSCIAPLKTKNTRSSVVFASFALIGLVLIASIALSISSVQANWTRGSFLNQEFRNQQPSTGNILYSLFGDGTPGATPYTRLWTGSCIPTQMQTLPSNFHGGDLPDNTISLLNSGTYTLTMPLTLSGCSALIGIGSPEIRSTLSTYTSLSARSNIIIDNILFNGQSTSTGILISGSQNITIHASDFFNHIGQGPTIANSTRVLLDGDNFYANTNGLNVLPQDDTQFLVINNSKFYNNNVGLHSYGYNSPLFLYFGRVSINNSQFFNNYDGVMLFGSGSVINNVSIYNNNHYGLWVTDLHIFVNMATIYNNRFGWYHNAASFYGNNVLFVNESNLFNTPILFPSSNTVGRSSGTLDTGATIPMTYDIFTNPQNASGDALLSGTNWSNLRGPQSFSVTQRPLRYIFGDDIPKQVRGVAFSGTSLVSYGNNGQDYDTNKYITESDPAFVTADMSIIQNYFGSGSWYTQNRQSNPCSLGSFQIVQLTPAMVNGNSYTLQGHTIYLLTGGEYTFGSAGNGFTFGGNCIALIGTDTTKIDKFAGGVNALLYANNKHHLIIDNLRLDGAYSNGGYTMPANFGISFDAATSDTTINHVQSYNMGQYGIFWGISAHHNTLSNSQTYNNEDAGLYLYLSSNDNIINNTQSYNNSGYGIWFANGSTRNAMNNFQAYNNRVGVFADLTTSSNIINRAQLYNNSDYGLYLKNSSGNILNDVKIYHNTIGVKTLFNSSNNTYFGQLFLFDNLSGDFDGTNGNDGTLTGGIVSPSIPFLAGNETLGANLMGCSYVTNPLAGTTISLLDTGLSCSNTGSSRGAFSGAVSDISYLFGADIYTQSVPVSYSGNTIRTLPTQYDSGKYIAEIFPIRDTTPENMSFTSIGNYPLSTGYTTSVYTAAIINTTVPVTLTLQGATSGHLVINGVSTGYTGQIQNGGSVQAWILSSSGFSQVVTGIVTIGSASASFTVTSRDPDILPSTGSFAFGIVTGAQIHTFVRSPLIVVQSIETGVLAQLTSPSSGWIEIYSGGQLLSSGTMSGMVFNGNSMRIVLQSSPSYQELITGFIQIGLGSGTFAVQTLPDTFPPEISFGDTVSASGYRNDTVSLLFTGANVFSGYQFVADPSGCSGSLDTGGWIPYTTGIVLSGHAWNDLYVCAYAQDIGHNISTGVSVLPLHISDLYFTDTVSSSPISFDTVSIGNDYVLNTKYAFTNSISQCAPGVSLTPFSGTINIHSILFNGQYFCAYGEDASGSGRYLSSSATINIDPNMPTLVFSDPVESGSVLSDTISLQVVGGIYNQLGYKYVSTPSDCSSLSGTLPYTGAITLQTEQYNGQYFCAVVSFSGFVLPLTSTYPISIDRTPPSIPLANAPLELQSSFFVVLESSGSSDGGVGMSGYVYQIAQDVSFLDIINTGRVTDVTAFTPQDFDALSGNYYRRLAAVDRLGNTSPRSNIGSFSLTDNADFQFSQQLNADTDRDYDSNTITLSSLRDGLVTRASIDKGTLFKNGRNKGTGAYVQNGDQLFIRLTSHSKSDRAVSSTLTIANKSIEYLITTRGDTSSCNVSSTDKDKIQTIFDSLVGQYEGDQSKYAEFLSTMKSMLQDNIDLTNDCNLSYLSNLVSNSLTGGAIDTTNHIAPNCKTYTVSYSTGKVAYTSPSFKVETYFATRDALMRFIDSKNPGDCHITTYASATTSFTNSDPSRHIAPNGKIYTINTTTTNGYTSPELTQKKYFSSLAALRAYLDSKNPPQSVRNHTVDASFTPLAYLAPNGKSYTIYKTNNGYMSYKLLKVKYFSTLTGIEAFITANNQK